MFHSISWQAFFATAGILLVIYYVFVGVAYFRQEIQQLLLGRAKNSSPYNELVTESPFEVTEENPGNPASPSSLGINYVRVTGPDLFPVAYALAEELKMLIKDAGRRGLVKEETVQAIRSVIKKQQYAGLGGTGFRQVINNLVEVETETHCSMHLAEEELNALWTL